ncbi:hypothetical protein AGOR_G00018580 [Albula goreensis]|uniref:Rho-GAP domain-containing protein n=1 Tax=Albula goreensis TaxID=1534307 RepID=A0A8T3E4X0_9TELE|nr:hypothetical protein AGOR_G00018580 [Albula goreensis]
MKNKAAKQKSKRKGNESAFGCDLTEHLENSGQDVPQVLRTCAEFIETHGIVDGIYRLSGITSNIQRLRQEYSSELSPELTREVYLQDIHCVGSLCKLYFRELPNPLLTFELYNKFMDAVSVKEEHEQLQHIQTLIQELPPSHYRTLEYLTKHLAHMATLSDQTNMHVRNLALVWAPNLLRSKEIDLPNCNGDTAFLEVRVQQAVVEFILNHVEEIFNHKVGSSVPKQGLSLACQTKCATLPASSQCPPMKLMSLEEAQARSMDQKYPAHKSRQRENSLPDTTTAAFYHTVIDLPDNKGSFSGKSKKWKSIFNLGRFVTETKGKQSRNGSVFVKTRKVSEKAPIRPTKSMDSLCSVSMEDNDSEFRQSSGGNDFFKPAFKSSTLESTYNLGEKDHECKPETLRGATAVSPKISGAARKCGTPPLQKAMPEQMKVFKGDNSNVQPNSPKNRRMLYTSSTTSSSSKLAFPGGFFPLESSPRYTPKAISISEPFAVSVPLRVSAVISSNSTPCRAQDKDEVSLLPCLPSREAALAQQGCGRRTSLCGDGNYLSLGKEDWQTTTKSGSVSTNTVPGGHDTEQKETHGMLPHYTKQEVTEPPGSLHTLFHASSQPASSTMFKDTKTGQETMTQVQVSSPTAAESAKQQTKLENQLQQHYGLEKLTQLDKEIIDQEEELWSTVGVDLKIVESDIVEDEFELDHLLTNNTGNYAPIKPYAHAKRGSTASSETKYACSSSELEMFLNDRRATMRRNSAPVSVSSIRTSFIIKTCQAKAVPVIPPKIQYSYVPQPPQTKNPEPSQEKDQGKVLKSSGKDDLELLKASNSVACPKEEIQNNKPASKTPRHIETSSSLMLYKATPPTDKPGLGRQYNSNGKASSESFRYDRSTVTQRHSFRTRPKRPQSLILFSPPFPIMDYPPLGDDSKLPLSPIKNCNETVTSQNAFKEEVKDNVKNQDSVRPKNKMAIPKIGQRLETSMSCFYQPQRTSMIFERTNRQMD